MKTTAAARLRAIAAECEVYAERVRPLHTAMAVCLRGFALDIRGFAEIIDKLDTFIRRDNGQVKNVDAITAIVDANWGNRESMIAAFNTFTRKHRDTSVKYILRQFGGAAP